MTPIFLLSRLLEKFGPTKFRAKDSTDVSMLPATKQGKEYGRYLPIFDGRAVPLSKAWFNKPGKRRQK